ncbi:Rieske domain-containing protein [Podospora appendiculata]|uniref:Rieske domain-containing protein n=1 Tax=Podospora appendiculata TaxID=314037 RepID=A0AAE1C8E9_9PEZI|nr:Rieske domain-containing protein [Podospora appendiculata]
MNIFNAFRAPSRSDADWFSVGLVSSFPDLGSDDDNLLQPRRTCNTDDANLEPVPGCKVFQVPPGNSSQSTEVPLSADGLDLVESPESEIGADLKDQVLVFQHKGKFHAIDHKCPHSSFPLSQGTPFDIEDFGIVLSAGLTCPKHGWSFDLFSGMADRGSYKLKVWEVQLRDLKPAPTDAATKAEQEVWVRRKQRMG